MVFKRVFECASRLRWFGGVLLGLWMTAPSVWACDPVPTRTIRVGDPFTSIQTEQKKLRDQLRRLNASLDRLERELAESQRRATRSTARGRAEQLPRGLASGQRERRRSALQVEGAEKKRSSTRRGLTLGAPADRSALRVVPSGERFRVRKAAGNVKQQVRGILGVESDKPLIFLDFGDDEALEERVLEAIKKALRGQPGVGARIQLLEMDSPVAPKADQKKKRYRLELIDPTTSTEAPEGQSVPVKEKKKVVF